MDEIRVISATVNVYQEAYGPEAEARIEENDRLIWAGPVTHTYGGPDTYVPQLQQRLEAAGYDPEELELVTLFTENEGVSGWIK